MIKYDEHNVYVNINKQQAEVLDGHYLKSKGGYRIPKNVHSLRELYKMTTNTDIIPLGIEEKEKLEKVQQLKTSDVIIDDRLRGYQNQDVHFLSNVEYAGVFLEPRMGKSPIMIKVLDQIKPKKTIIVVPSSLTYNWQKEIEKWSNCFEIFVYYGTPKQRILIRDKFSKSNHPNKILIISKDTLKKDLVMQEIKYDVAIVDEGHFLRNYKSLQSKAVFNLKANKRFCLTGTPTSKHSVEIFGILHFLNPKKYPSYWGFAERYFEMDDNHWGGKLIGNVKPYRQQELLSIMDESSTMRKRKDHMQWLPKSQKQTIYVKMEPKQLKLYDQMLETFMATDEETEVDTMNKLSQLMRLRQLCLEPRLLGFDKVVGAKTTALLEFAEDNDDPFIVMTTFSSYFALIKPELEKLGKKVGVIDGSVSQKDKFKTAEAFQNGKFDILLCNIIAAGTGFTLDRADTIVFLDKDFNPANNEQAQDRIVPTTKQRMHSINIISLVVAGSIDERVNDILDNKEDLTKLINKREVFV